MIRKQGATLDHGVPKHILGRLSVTVVAGSSCVFSRCLIVKIRCVPLFLPDSRHCLYLYLFCCVGFADSACPMTFGRVATVQPKTVTLVNPLASFVRQDVVPNAVNIKKHRLTPLERELEAVEGISLTELGQPVPEVLGRVSIVTPTTASRARFHPQLRQCFVDQSWPDKELVVVETYHNEPSAFFQRGGMEFFFWAFFCFLVLWSPGPLVPWSSGPPVPWSSGPPVLWSPGPPVLWSSGPLVLWSSSSTSVLDNHNNNKKKLACNNRGQR